MDEIPRSNHAQINDGAPHSAQPPAQPSAQPGHLPRYIPPQVISYSNEDILEQLGPVQAQVSKPSNSGFDFGIPGEGMPGNP